jgi:hypothetical protein
MRGGEASYVTILPFYLRISRVINRVLVYRQKPFIRTSLRPVRLD